MCFCERFKLLRAPQRFCITLSKFACQVRPGAAHICVPQGRRERKDVNLCLTLHKHVFCSERNAQAALPGPARRAGDQQFGKGCLRSFSCRAAEIRELLFLTASLFCAAARHLHRPEGSKISIGFSHGKTIDPAASVLPLHPKRQIT